ncbi:MAG: hypothetical protein U1F65_04740 [Verrucomicrobiota bacterium]
MTRKTILTVGGLALLAGISLYLNRDRFAPEVIKLSSRSITPRGWFTRGPLAKSASNPVVFLITKRLRLRSVKVVLAEDAQTNKYPRAVWSLTTESNSVPVREFIYGATVGGMHVAVKGVGADPLQPGVNYRILVETDSEKLQHDFVPVPRTR